MTTSSYESFFVDTEIFQKVFALYEIETVEIHDGYYFELTPILRSHAGYYLRKFGIVLD